MPLGRVEATLGRLPVVDRVIERLNAARTENAVLHLTDKLFENDREEYSSRRLRENHAWILANAVPPRTAVNGGAPIAMLVTAFNYRSLAPVDVLVNGLGQIFAPGHFREDASFRTAESLKRTCLVILHKKIVLVAKAECSTRRPLVDTVGPSIATDD
jgi:hypothetical protein